MTEMVKKIIALEWELFDQVQNLDGRAPCQDNKDTFGCMRSSQLAVWSKPIQTSYYQDLQEAQAEKRNLLSEKYAYMMERTSPSEYARIAQQLPKIDEEKQRLIAQICAIHVAWQEELARQYPHLTGRGRAIRKSADGFNCTSFETYLWGEMKTYSRSTVRLYAAYVESVRQAGGNLNQQVLENTAKQYGYPSIATAEKRLAESGDKLPQM